MHADFCILSLPACILHAMGAVSTRPATAAGGNMAFHATNNVAPAAGSDGGAKVDGSGSGGVGGAFLSSGGMYI